MAPQIVEQGDLLAEVLAVGQECSEGGEALEGLTDEVVDRLWRNSRADKWLEPLPPEALGELLLEAQLLCLDLLEEDT